MIKSKVIYYLKQMFIRWLESHAINLPKNTNIYAWKFKHKLEKIWNGRRRKLGLIELFAIEKRFGKVEENFEQLQEVEICEII